MSGMTSARDQYRVCAGPARSSDCAWGSRGWIAVAAILAASTCATLSAELTKDAILDAINANRGAVGDIRVICEVSRGVQSEPGALIQYWRDDITLTESGFFVDRNYVFRTPDGMRSQPSWSGAVDGLFMGSISATGCVSTDPSDAGRMPGGGVMYSVYMGWEFGRSFVGEPSINDLAALVGSELTTVLEESIDFEGIPCIVVEHRAADGQLVSRAWLDPAEGWSLRCREVFDPTTGEVSSQWRIDEFTTTPGGARIPARGSFRKFQPAASDGLASELFEETFALLPVDASGAFVAAATQSPEAKLVFAEGTLVTDLTSGQSWVASAEAERAATALAAVLPQGGFPGATRDAATPIGIAGGIGVGGGLAALAFGGYLGLRKRGALAPGRKARVPA